MDMGKKNLAILLTAVALYVGLIIWFSSDCKRAESKMNEAYQQAALAMGERDNALALAEQYKKQYQESVLEIAELKGEIESLNEQIDALREPPEGVYDTEFGYDYDYVIRVVAAEARGEPFAGMLAVAQCIEDTARRTGQTPEQVVKSGQYTSPVSRSCTDNMEMVNEACLIVFAEHDLPFDEPIEYFYSTNGYSAWHESQTFCYEIGTHRYFKRTG